MRRRALDLPARHLLSAAAVVRASTARPRARRLGQDPRARRCPAPPGPESVSEADPRRTRLMLRTRASATDLCTRLVERIPIFGYTGTPAGRPLRRCSLPEVRPRLTASMLLLPARHTISDWLPCSPSTLSSFRLRLLRLHRRHPSHR